MIIVCPQCGRELELSPKMLYDITSCAYCKARFVATEWSGVLLTENELARYAENISYQKLAKEVKRYFGTDNDYVREMACRTLGLASAFFET